VNLAGYMAAKIVEPEIKKKFFGAFVPFGAYMSCYSASFHSGCALGCVLADHKQAAFRLFSGEGAEDGIVQSFPVDNILSLDEFVDREQMRIQNLIVEQMRIQNLIVEQKPPTIDELLSYPFYDPAKVDELIAAAFIYGVVLGCQRPSVVEKTWDSEQTLEEGKQNMKQFLREWISNVASCPELLPDYGL
jgi:hypothetical protein